MSTQQDIYAAGSENRPPMLNKDNYVPWSSRLLRYAKTEFTHEQIDDELTDKEVKQIEADDQATQTIRMGLPKDIYAIVDSCDTTREIWLRVKQMMKGSSIGITRNQNGYNAVQNVKNQVFQNEVQNPGVQNVGNQNGLIVVPMIANQNANQTRNGNVVAARARGNSNGNNEAGIQLQAKEFDLMAVSGDIDEIDKVNANCILMANLQQASTMGTQTNKAPVYDLDGSVEVHHNDNCYDNDIFNMFTQEEHVEHNGGTIEQHPTTVEETRAYFESLYNNLVTEVEKVNTVNRKMRETNADLTTELARYKGLEKSFEFNQAKFDELETGYRKSVYQEQCLTKKINALHLKGPKFNQDFKSIAKEADKSLDKITVLENENERLLRAVVSHDIMSIVQRPTVVEMSDLQTELERTKERFKNFIIKKENEYAKLWNDWYKKCEECKYDKISYDKAYNNMQHQIEQLQAQLGDLKGKSMDTQCASDTLDLLSRKLEDENVSLEF
ncbi:hypothetical protein Tco_1221582 [Tanacetum coccineum]